MSAFDFEKDLVAREEELAALEATATAGDTKADAKAAAKVAALRRDVEELRRSTYANLTAWQRVQIARHKDRPRALDYIKGLTTEFTELHGDRHYGDDAALVAGMARFNGQPVAVLGQQKGKDTKENVRRNFGMMHPEGYRKALRVMQLAEKFSMPIITFVDTPGAYPGLGAEERGQAEAIARNIQEMAGFAVPMVMVVIGEGASGGALGVGIADRILMLENAWYCVISPEGCAAILYKDGTQASRAAEALKLTAPDLLKLGVIDAIVPEPLGGAHRHVEETIANVGKAIADSLAGLTKLSTDKLLENRFTKFRTMGQFQTAKA